MAESNARLSDEMLDKRLFIDFGMLCKTDDGWLLWRFYDIAGFSVGFVGRGI